VRKKTATVLAVFLYAFVPVLFAFPAEDVQGLWKIVDEKSNKAQAYVILYIYDHKLYGRMVATIDDKTGRIKDTLERRSERAKKLAGEPYYVGMDFIYRLEDTGKEWKGQILNPQSGDEYECCLWREGNKLIVRGQLRGFSFLGRNQVWVQASVSELGGFVPPDPHDFVPIIPRKKQRK